MTGESLKHRLLAKGITPSTFQHGNEKRVLLTFAVDEHLSKSIKK